MLEPPVCPMVAPRGVPVEVTPERRKVLLKRGYRDAVPPQRPTVPVGGRRSDVRISAAVAHVPWAPDRVRCVEQMRDAVPGLQVITDDSREGCWPTIRRAWEAGQTAGGTHHLVLTDDLVLAPGFWDALAQAVATFPKAPISLLSVQRGARLAAEAGYRWCISWGVTGAANVLPVPMVGEFLAWSDENVRPECPHDDVRLSGWISARGVGAMTPVPCLVQHGDYPSVIEDSPLYGRTHAPAAVFCSDARSIDWSERADEPVFIGVSVYRPDQWFVGGRTLADIREQVGGMVQ